MSDIRVTVTVSLSVFALSFALSFFLSWEAKTQLNHWTKRVVSTSSQPGTYFAVSLSLSLFLSLSLSLPPLCLCFSLSLQDTATHCNTIVFDPYPTIHSIYCWYTIGSAGCMAGCPGLICDSHSRYPSMSCVYTYIFIHKYEQIDIQMYMYLCICMSICLYIYAYVFVLICNSHSWCPSMSCVHTCIFIHKYEQIHTNVYACMYKYVYVCIHICIHICIDLR